MFRLILNVEDIDYDMLIDMISQMIDRKSVV